MIRERKLTVCSTFAELATAKWQHALVIRGVCAFDNRPQPISRVWKLSIDLSMAEEIYNNGHLNGLQFRFFMCTARHNLPPNHAIRLCQCARIINGRRCHLKTYRPKMYLEANSADKYLEKRFPLS